MRKSENHLLAEPREVGALCVGVVRPSGRLLLLCHLSPE